MSALLDAFIARLKADPFSDAWKQEQYTALGQILSEHLAGATSVIDLGCGEGLFSNCLHEALPPDTPFVGMDIAEESAWATQPELNYVVGDASRPPFRSGAVSTVVAKDLLHHMDDPRMGVDWLLRMATDRVVIVEANYDNPIMAFYTKQNGDQHMTTDQFKTLFRDVDPDVSWSYSSAKLYPFYLPPVKDAHAIWVWPVTALMILAFKVFKSRAAARMFGRLVKTPRWAPPFNIAVAELSQGLSGPTERGTARALTSA